MEKNGIYYYIGNRNLKGRQKISNLYPSKPKNIVKMK